MHVRLACALQSYTPAAEALIKAAKAPGQDAGSYINAAKRVAPGPEASMHVTPLNKNKTLCSVAVLIQKVGGFWMGCRLQCGCCHARSARPADSRLARHAVHAQSMRAVL